MAIPAIMERNLALEATSLTLSAYEVLKEKLSSLDLVPTKGLVEKLRNIKDADEIRQGEFAIPAADAPDEISVADAFLVL